MEKRFKYDIVKPGTPAYRDYLALRHKVFCEELKRLPRFGQSFGDIPLESDEYDANSLHVLCRMLETGVAVGCSRMILPNAKGLSITSRYTISHQTDISTSHIGEISRLAIASELRRFRGEPTSDGLQEPSSQRQHPVNMRNRQDGSLVAMGLYRENFKLAHKYGLTHFYAAMEPSLARLLVRIGFPFQKVGPLNTIIKPARQPYFIGVHAIRVAMPTCQLQFIFEPYQDKSTLADSGSQTNWLPAVPLQTGQLEHSGQCPAFGK